MAPTNTTVDSLTEEFLDSLVTIASSSKDEIVLLTCVDQDGDLGETEAYASSRQPKCSLPWEVVLTFPESRGVDTVLVTSRAAGSLDSVADSDIQFTRDLIEAAGAHGIEVLDHNPGPRRRLQTAADDNGPLGLGPTRSALPARLRPPVAAASPFHPAPARRAPETRS